MPRCVPSCARENLTVTNSAQLKPRLSRNLPIAFRYRSQTDRTIILAVPEEHVDQVRNRHSERVLPMIGKTPYHGGYPLPGRDPENFGVPWPSLQGASYLPRRQGRRGPCTQTGIPGFPKSIAAACFSGRSLPGGLTRRVKIHAIVTTAGENRQAQCA